MTVSLQPLVRAFNSFGKAGGLTGVCVWYQAALVYDYLITFPLEVQLFWRGNRTGACLLFFANRYLTLFNFIFSIATSVQMSDSVRLHVHAVETALTNYEVSVAVSITYVSMQPRSLRLAMSFQLHSNRQDFGHYAHSAIHSLGM